jgi:hypothetical protein
MDYTNILNATTNTGVTIPFRPSSTAKGNKVLSVLHRTPKGEYIWKGSGAMVDWSIMKAKDVTDIKTVTIPGFPPVKMTAGLTSGGNPKMSGRVEGKDATAFIQISRSTTKDGTERAYVIGTIAPKKERKVKESKAPHSYTF